MINKSIDALVWLRKQLETDDKDLLREMVRSFAEELMSAETNVVCGAGYREVSADRINRRNGYRSRRWDTRVGSIDLKIPKLRTGFVFPGLAPGREDPVGTGVHPGRYRSLCAGRLHPESRRSRRDTRRLDALEVPGLRDGQKPRRDGYRLPEPAT